jgi:hypothetical protein
LRRSRLLRRQDVAQSHERDEVAQLRRRVAESQLAAGAPRDELETCERLHRRGICADPVDVAEDDRHHSKDRRRRPESSVAER